VELYSDCALSATILVVWCYIFSPFSLSLSVKAMQLMDQVGTGVNISLITFLLLSLYAWHCLHAATLFTVP